MNNTKVFFEDMVNHPGKFEGEAAYVPYYWHEYLNGCADEDDGEILTFNVESGDKAVFPELADRDTVKLYERDDGFVIEVS